ncbi:competence type IV pilus major pilin ComGC [Aerococcaceae bacterium 50-4]
MKKLLIKLIKKSRQKQGFTLIEMVIVLFIVAALLLLIIPNMSKQATKAEETTNSALVETVEAQGQIYMLEENKDAFTPEELANKGYISTDQLEQYNTIPVKPE